jgi:hypothetical protein
MHMLITKKVCGMIKVGCTIKLAKMRHAMIKVAVWVAVCGMIDANTDYYMLINHQPF